MMDAAPSPMRDLARRLLAIEAVGGSEAHSHAQGAVRACEKLRSSLTRFAGADGFAALMRRALALAQAEVPALGGIQVKADGSLQGLEELAAKATGGVDDGAEASLAITAQLLSLLATFIGKPLTLRLVREGWPGASLDE